MGARPFTGKWATEGSSTIKTTRLTPRFPWRGAPHIALHEETPNQPPKLVPMDAGADGGHAGAAAGLEDADAAFFSRRGHRCCCFWAPWQSSSSYARRAGAGAGEEWWHHVGEGRGGVGGERRRWWRRGVEALMKVREWSELVAGPRWKTFIRRFRRSPRHGGGGGRNLNYDPLSYALNFDEGHGASPEGDYTGYRDFSTRFAAPPGSAKSSMDLGGHNAPPLLHHPPPHTPPATAARS